MSQREEQWIEAVTESLGDDAEMQLMARQHLGEMLNWEASDADFELATERLKNAGGQKWRRVWMVLVLVVSLPMLVGIAVEFGGNLGSFKSVFNPMMAVSGPGSSDRPSWVNDLTDEERLILFGDGGAASEAGRWKALWDSDPDNPSYFQDYAVVYTQEHGSLPPDFLETGARIDPGNGWYRQIVAGQDIISWVEQESIPPADREAGMAEPHAILDEEEFAKRIRWLHEAALAPRLKNLSGELAQKRFELIPEASEFGEMVRTINLVLATQRFEVSSYRIYQAFAAEAQRCQRENDREGMQALITTWNRFVEVCLEDSSTLIDALITQGFMVGSLPSMRDAALALDLNGDSWRNLEKAVRERKQELAARSNVDPMIDQHGSILGSLSLVSTRKMAIDIEPLSLDDLRPAVRVEQALVGRLASVVGLLMVGLVLLGSLIAASRVPQLIQVLARRCQALLGPADWLWVVAGGVIVPLLVFLLFRYATPWARLDWGPKGTLYAVPLGHFLALLLMGLVWPVVIASWRLEKQGGVFGWTLRMRLIAVVALLAPLLGMLLLGLGIPLGEQSIYLGLAAIAAGVFTLVWGILRPGVGSEKGFSRSLQRTSLLFASRPAWLGAMLGFAVLLPWFKAEERRWMARDELLKPTAAMTGCESRVTEQVIKELRQLLYEHPVD